MKKFFSIIAILMSALLLGQEATPALTKEAEKDWELSLAMTYSGHYFDKGKYSNTDPVMLLDAEFTWKQLFVGATGIYDFTDETDHDNSFEEYDYIAGWRPSIGGDWNFFLKGLDFQFAYIHYVYPKYREDDSNEINLAVNAQCFLAPGVDVYWDFENNIFYGNFNVSHSIELTEKLALNLGAALWWGNHQFQERDFEVSRNSLFSAEVGAALEYSITDNLTVSPFVQCGWALGKEMRNSWRAEDHQEAFNTNYGVTLAWKY